ncbi:MAG TPA: ABC transporter ATP-binding protein [Candidatus Dormibacteraeota bacterium]|nr:ABC transporter ATP-binding protein [Candidatus Dormibacteraeota bacterium]
MLEVKGLVAGYAGSEVLHGIDLVVNDGEGVIVLGPNGHGKTTLLRAITGLLPPRAGQVLLDGKEITRLRPDVIAASGVVHIPQGDLLFPDMTVTENLLMGAYHRPTWAERRERLDRVYELFPWLKQRGAQLTRTLSGGERRMLALGRGLMAKARILLIDEPSLGLAPLTTEQIYASIHKVKESGIALLLADENANHVAGLADRVYLLETGSLVRQGPADTLLKDQALLESYLG